MDNMERPVVKQEVTDVIMKDGKIEIHVADQPQPFIFDIEE